MRYYNLKLYTLLCLAYLIAGKAVGQDFAKRFKLDLPDTLQTGKVNWGDLDNDGLLDVVVNTIGTSGRAYVVFVRTDTTALPIVNSVQEIPKHSAIELMDYNRDNLIDVLIAGETYADPTQVFLNKGNFTFELYPVFANAFSIFRFADLDNDGQLEWIVNVPTDSGTYVRILKNHNGTWNYAGDGWKMQASDIKILPGDGEGFSDLFLSGRVNEDSLFTGVLRGEDDLTFAIAANEAWIGKGHVVDVNGDGLNDIQFAGKDKSGMSVTKQWLGLVDETFSVSDVGHVYDSVSMFLADFNSNGVPDISYHAITASGDTINIIQYDNAAAPFILPHRKVVAQQFGDYEHDGDLDLVQLVDESDTLRLVYLLNNASENEGPTLDLNKLAALGFLEHIFLYWDEAIDDFTPSKSITYDLGFKNKDGDILAAEFDVLNTRRLKPTGGNNGSQHFKLLKHVAVENFFWTVQAVDNALHTHVGGKGTCTGGGADGIESCSETDYTQKEIKACSGEVVSLSSPPDALWFSFKDGFLGIKSSYEINVNSADTIFYFDRNKPSCGGITAFLVSIDDKPRVVKMPDVLTCENKPVELTIEDGWSVSWSSMNTGLLGTTSTITYSTSLEDSVFATMNNGKGCTLLRKRAIKFSKAVVDATPQQVKIMKGDFVTLSVTGATQYTWSPTVGLDDPATDHPIASPILTTMYWVTGTDSIGCTSRDSIMVFVEETGFIPNLFTPNGDAVNDELKVFGLPSAKEFSLKIYNREGSILFQTNDVATAARGWDGKHKGVEQPGGVYYWKVAGLLQSGEKLLLNGKESGSVVLIR